ncbi:FIG137776: Glycosyltransferase [hydrothermal vent metagenome]|uniref:FIG137776: Glycosyltransferase n=1 Tax=hydrothermal vent metagenome TaxID=652676 RepID=A0A3B0XCM1_9ZZZZ
MGKRLKILWLSHMIPYPPKGGALQRAYNLVNELSKHHDVYLLAFSRPNVYRQIFNSYEEGLQEATTYLSNICKDIKFLPLPYDNRPLGKYRLLTKGLLSADGYTINWLKSKEMAAVVTQWAEKYQFDAVHFDTISLVPYKQLISNSATTLDHHNIESDMLFTRKEKEKNIIKQFYFWQEAKKLQVYEKQHCDQFDINLTCSQLDSERLLKICPSSKEIVIPNGVDINYFVPGNHKATANSMVFAGGLSWYPNLDAMHFLTDEIWPLLKKSVPDVTMNVIGKNPSKKLLSKNEKDKNFIVHGFVDDVRPYISNAMIYVCPIRDGGGTKLKILDALAMGCAIVAHPMAIEGIDLTHNENVMLAETAEDFVQQITSLFNNPLLRKKLSENGRQVAVNNYSYDSIGKKLADTFVHLNNTTNDDSAN